MIGGTQPCFGQQPLDPDTQLRQPTEMTIDGDG